MARLSNRRAYIQAADGNLRGLSVFVAERQGEHDEPLRSVFVLAVGQGSQASVETLCLAHQPLGFAGMWQCWEQTSISAQLRSSIGESEPNHVDAVLLYDGSAETTIALAELVSALQPYRRGLVVAVAPDDERDLTAGIDGYVLETTASFTSLEAVLSVLGALAAPETLTCLEHIDVAASLGSAGRPALVVQALWLRETRQLTFIRLTDPMTVRTADRITALFRVDLMDWGEMHEIASAVRMAAGAGCVLTYQAPRQMWSAQLPPGVGLVTMICRQSTDPASPISALA